MLSTLKRWWLVFCLVVLAAGVEGCGKSKVDQALDSDANGYVCADCQAKFYTEREVFANHCPQCKQGNLVQVLGYACAEDQHVTLAARGRIGVRCEKCGKPTGSIAIPREKDLQGWGAAKKTAAEAGVN